MPLTEFDQLLAVIKQRRPRPRPVNPVKATYLLEVDAPQNLLRWMRQHLASIHRVVVTGGCACCVLDLEIEAEAEVAATLATIDAKPAWDGVYRKG